MATNLRLTTAGRNAVLDEDNVGTAAVTITKMALGAGSGTEGAGNDARTTLRDQRDIVAVAGATSAAGQIALRAEFNSASAYAATEMGLFARIGMGAEFLFAYWTDGGEVFINKPAKLRTIVAVTVALVNSEADVEVTVSPAVSVSAVAALLDLSDAPNSYVNAARRKVAVNSAGTGVEFVEGLLPSETTAINTLITAAINDLIDGAPGALNTLNELAAAIGDDADFRATVLGLIKARLTQAQVDGRIRSFFGDASSREFTAAGVHNYSWEWDTPNALAILVGGGGGGGQRGDSTPVHPLRYGVGGGAATTTWRGGPKVHIIPVSGSIEGGDGGGGGGQTAVTVSGTRYTARGGGGGGGGGSTGNIDNAPGGPGGAGGPYTRSMTEYVSAAASNVYKTRAGSPGLGGAGRNGGAGDSSPAPNSYGSGGEGGGGEVVVQLLTSLTKGQSLAIEVAGGGDAATPRATAGDPGSVRLVPLF